jgi:uncharacterized membrane protein
MAINYLKKYLSKEDLEEIKNEISVIEKSTTAEIRLCLKLKRGFHERKKSFRELALKEFYKIGMNNTKDKTGVLIYILFLDRKFEIIADEGINSKISSDIWNKIISHIRNEFSQNNYKTGILKCLIEMKGILISSFPQTGAGENELSDDIIIEK